MKNLYKLIILFFLNNFCFAQQTVFSRDSILFYFKKYEPLIAYQKLQNKFNFVDNKLAYNDREIKSYLLKCLDRKINFEQYSKNEDENFLKLISDEKRLLVEIEAFCIEKNKSKREINSILNSQNMLLKYKDSIIKSNHYFNRKNKNFRFSYPNLKALVNFKYREVYDSIKKWSLENPSIDLSLELLNFNDPETVKLYDKRITDYVNSNGKIKTKLYNIRECNTGLTFSKLTELIKIDKINVSFAGHIITPSGEMLSKNTEINESISLLGSNNFFNKILEYKLPSKNLVIKYEKLKSGDIIDERKLIKENQIEIVKAILAISKLMIKEEEYWMINMPFYKKKK